jgi:hypothetical protein
MTLAYIRLILRRARNAPVSKDEGGHRASWFATRRFAALLIMRRKGKRYS